MNYIYISRSTSSIKSRYFKAVSILALNLGRNTMSFLIDGQKGMRKAFFNTTGLGTNIWLACTTRTARKARLACWLTVCRDLPITWNRVLSDPRILPLS